MDLIAHRPWLTQFKMTDKMVLLNPFNIMKKGYSIVYKEDNIVSSSKDNLQI